MGMAVQKKSVRPFSLIVTKKILCARLWFVVKKRHFCHGGTKALKRISRKNSFVTPPQRTGSCGKKNYTEIKDRETTESH